MWIWSHLSRYTGSLSLACGIVRGRLPKCPLEQNIQRVDFNVASMTSSVHHIRAHRELWWTFTDLQGFSQGLHPKQSFTEIRTVRIGSGHNKSAMSLHKIQERTIWGLRGDTCRQLQHATSKSSRIHYNYADIKPEISLKQQKHQIKELKWSKVKDKERPNVFFNWK